MQKLDSAEQAGTAGHSPYCMVCENCYVRLLRMMTSVSGFGLTLVLILSISTNKFVVEKPIPHLFLTVGATRISFKKTWRFCGQIDLRSLFANTGRGMRSIASSCPTGLDVCAPIQYTNISLHTQTQIPTKTNARKSSISKDEIKSISRWRTDT